MGEEATETVIAAKNGDNDELKNEINDLLYHVMVLAANSGTLSGLTWKRYLTRETKKIGNLKKFSSGRQEHLIMCIPKALRSCAGLFFAL